MEPSGLLLRFTSDLQLIVSEEKKIMALCEYLRFLATEKGIGSLTIEDHEMEPRMHEAHFPLFCEIFFTRCDVDLMYQINT